jgi:hypothetical protein
MRKFSKKHYLAAGAAAALIVGGAGMAYAYWTTTGSGDGSGSAGTTSNWTVAFQTTTDDTAGVALSPGGATQTVHFTVKNADSGHAALNDVTLTVANAASAFSSRANTSLPACTASDFEISNVSLTDGAATPTVRSSSTNDVTGSPLYDVAGGSTITGTATLALLNGTDNQDNCQGVTVPVHAAVS